MQKRGLGNLYSVETKGHLSAMQLLEQAGNKMKDFNVKSLHNIAEAIVSEARSNLQNNTSVYTGELNASINILEETSEYVTVGTPLFYAIYVEYGRGPVNPIRAKVLHFFTKDGKEVFTTHSAASEPRPFLEPAVITQTKNLSLIYAENTNAELQELRTESND